MLYIFVSIYFPQRLRVDLRIHAQRKRWRFDGTKVGKLIWNAREIMMEKYFQTQQFPLQIQSNKPKGFGRNSKITGINSFPNHITRWQVKFFPIFTDYCYYCECYVLGCALMWLEYSHAVIETFSCCSQHTIQL